MGRNTDLIQHPYRAPDEFEAPQPGIFKASTVFFPSVAAMRSRDWKNKTGYTYGLHGTPTTFTLEERICQLEGARHAVLLPSGLAALALVNLALLKSGDEILIPDNAYGPLKSLAEVELAHWGITHQYYDPMQPLDLAQRITPQTRLVWLEAPGSVTLEFPPLIELLKICRSHKVLAALDNTCGAGVAFAPFHGVTDNKNHPDGVDICVHALTKYPSGGADVLMGSVCTRDRALHDRLNHAHEHLGYGLGQNDVELVLRGLPSVALRYAAHDAATRQVAGWLSQRPEVAQVLHPALPGSPGHEHWAATCQGAAGLVSMVFDADRFSAERVDAFVEALRLFRIGYSWGGPMSLVVPYKVQGMRRFGHLAGQRGSLVRLAIGLEDVGDLIADLDQAFRVLNAA